MNIVSTPNNVGSSTTSNSSSSVDAVNVAAAAAAAAAIQAGIPSHAHSRSQSDPTKRNSSSASNYHYHHHLRTPESDLVRLVASSTSNNTLPYNTNNNDHIYQDSLCLKKRKLTLDTFEDFDYSEYEVKRSRTAPPSPPYEIDFDLKARSPLTLPPLSKTTTMTGNVSNNNIRSRSLSPRRTLATPIPSISEPVASSNHTQDTVPLSPLNSLKAMYSPGSMQEFPDTCYKFNTKKNHTEFNENIYENDEWKQKLEILIKAVNPVTYTYLKEYCNDVSKNYKTESSNIDFNSKISSKIQRNTNMRLAEIISNKYKSNQAKQQNKKMKISSIINFPFESNYTYQSVGYLKDIEMINNNYESLRQEAGNVNLDKYAHLFNTNNTPLTGSRENEEVSGRRKSSFSAMSHRAAVGKPYVTTDLPMNFATSSSTAYQVPTSPIHRQHQAFPQQQHTFVNSSPNQAHHHYSHQPYHQQHQQPQASAYNNHQHHHLPPSPTSMTSTPTTRILPPTTPKMSSSALSSPNTSPNSKSQHHRSHHVRTCISCKSTQSPCWRPSWSIASGQLCNSCGLRYKKTGAHCVNEKCLRIPAKGEWALMKNRGKLEFHDKRRNEIRHCYKCLHCGEGVEVNE